MHKHGGQRSENFSTENINLCIRSYRSMYWRLSLDYTLDISIRCIGIFGHLEYLIPIYKYRNKVIINKAGAHGPQHRQHVFLLLGVSQVLKDCMNVMSPSGLCGL